MSTLQLRHVGLSAPLQPFPHLAMPAKGILANHVEDHCSAHHHATHAAYTVYSGILADALAREAFYESVCQVFPPESL